MDPAKIMTAIELVDPEVDEANRVLVPRRVLVNGEEVTVAEGEDAIGLRVDEDGMVRVCLEILPARLVVRSKASVERT